MHAQGATFVLGAGPEQQHALQQRVPELCSYAYDAERTAADVPAHAAAACLSAATEIQCREEAPGPRRARRFNGGTATSSVL